jgi:chromosome segregation ATPase
MATENDNLGGVPKITPSRDEIASFQRDKGRSMASRLGEVPDVASTGSSTTTKVILAFATLAVLAALSWSMILHKKLGAAEQAIGRYEQRISGLENQLYVTDESMSESSVAMKVKIREMDSEIRKLWDNVWKKQKEQLAAHNKKLAQHDSFIAANKKQLSNNQTVVMELTEQLASSRQVLVTVKSNQQRIASQEASLEGNSDKVNRLSSDIVKLTGRVKESEDWVDSINGFRRQVNRDICELKRDLGGLSGSL